MMRTRKLYVMIGCLALAHSSSIAQVVDRQPKPLPDKTVELLIASLEWLIDAKLDLQQRAEMRELILQEWDQRNYALTWVADTITFGFSRIASVPEETLQIHLTSTLLAFIGRAETSFDPEDRGMKILTDAYRRAHPPVVRDAPLFTVRVGDAYLDAFLLCGSVLSGKPAPELSASSRSKLRMALARDYARLVPELRAATSNDVRRALERTLAWPQLGTIERQLIRDELGVPMTDLQRQATLRTRSYFDAQKWSPFATIARRLTTWRKTHLPSAPYWDPATGKWSQADRLAPEFR